MASPALSGVAAASGNISEMLELAQRQLRDELTSEIAERETRLTAALNSIGLVSIDELEDFIFIHGAAKLIPTAATAVNAHDETQTETIISPRRRDERNRQRKTQLVAVTDELSRTKAELDYTKQLLQKEQAEKQHVKNTLNQLLDQHFQDKKFGVAQNQNDSETQENLIQAKLEFCYEQIRNLNREADDLDRTLAQTQQELQQAKIELNSLHGKLDSAGIAQRDAETREENLRNKLEETEREREKLKETIKIMDAPQQIEEVVRRSSRTCSPIPAVVAQRAIASPRTERAASPRLSTRPRTASPARLPRAPVVRMTQTRAPTPMNVIASTSAIPAAQSASNQIRLYEKLRQSYQNQQNRIQKILAWEQKQSIESLQRLNDVIETRPELIQFKEFPSLQEIETDSNFSLETIYPDLEATETQANALADDLEQWKKFALQQSEKVQQGQVSAGLVVRKKRRKTAETSSKGSISADEKILRADSDSTTRATRSNTLSRNSSPRSPTKRLSPYKRIRSPLKREFSRAESTAPVNNSALVAVSATAAPSLRKTSTHESELSAKLGATPRKLKPGKILFDFDSTANAPNLVESPRKTWNTIQRGQISQQDENQPIVAHNNIPAVPRAPESSWQSEPETIPEQIHSDPPKPETIPPKRRSRSQRGGVTGPSRDLLPSSRSVSPGKKQFLTQARSPLTPTKRTVNTTPDSSPLTSLSSSTHSQTASRVPSSTLSPFNSPTKPSRKSSPIKFSPSRGRSKTSPSKQFQIKEEPLTSPQRRPMRILPLLGLPPDPAADWEAVARHEKRKKEIRPNQFPIQPTNRVAEFTEENVERRIRAAAVQALGDNDVTTPIGIGSKSGAKRKRNLIPDSNSKNPSASTTPIQNSPRKKKARISYVPPGEVPLDHPDFSDLDLPWPETSPGRRHRLARIQQKRKIDLLASNKLKQAGNTNLSTRQVEIDPQQNQGLNFAFKEVVRKKSDRAKMLARDCEDCAGYYREAHPNLELGNKECAGHTNFLDTRNQLLQQRLNKTSRHRDSHRPAPLPVDYMQLGMPSTAKLNDLNERARAQDEQERLYREEEARRGGGMYRFKD